MRSIAAVAPAPLRFPEAVVASPGRGPMQHLLPGDDLTVGPRARGRFAARSRRQAAEQQGAGAVEGGDCRRALHRKQTGRQGFHHEGTENTEKELLRFARWLNGRLREAPKIPASPWSPCLRGGILACSLQCATPGDGCRDCRPMEASGATNDVLPAVRPSHEGSIFRAAGISRESRTSSHAEPAAGHSSRWSPGGVGGATGRRGRQPGTFPSRRSGAIREFRQRPYGTTCGGLGGRTGLRGCLAGTSPPASGAIRESRQRPYETLRGGLGGRTGRQGCRPGTSPPASGGLGGRTGRRGRRPGSCPRSEERNSGTSDTTPATVCHPATTTWSRGWGLAAGPGAGDAGQGPARAASGAIRESRTRPLQQSAIRLRSGGRAVGLGGRTERRGRRPGTCCPLPLPVLPAPTPGLASRVPNAIPLRGRQEAVDMMPACPATWRHANGGCRALLRLTRPCMPTMPLAPRAGQFCRARTERRR
jgi:hypothetical protein